MFVRLYKGLRLTHVLVEKIAKNKSKIAVLRLQTAYTPPIGQKNGIFEQFFAIFPAGLLVGTKPL